MNIGRLSGLTGVTAKTIRYYESIGLIPEPPRKPSGYRDYGDSDVEVLRFVSKARLLGFPLKDVTQLLSLWQDRGRSSAEVKALTESHITDIEQRIEELQSVRRTLLDLSRRCHGDTRPDCPILDDLAG
ncbi:MAG: Cu(I)-responsive transcriptional regulator [Rhodospirillaceae bacterium]|jgi:MerR family copper efflux transcriptional regulator|nr:Cu(I)-responsive transcriptional regulator [Rhodospirillaceae bacterium]MBT3885560.1 Cu(I)-responsive transcriptional regulator [Rhodospirillaceae bacterium]MBT4116639.1 Cu(I)-responsive transcriptional regulator [Rhodospirillaceae bacterium]MBT4671513.1 Cu(I)-responsive transcriptional regulator [Rhodospirillaceae bacterium]MBT4720640.1 Cu(I)-responsive transcriptional regulator [Rhodospirillaceae bacterium]